jgi:hypothetical protein
VINKRLATNDPRRIDAVELHRDGFAISGDVGRLGAVGFPPRHTCDYAPADTLMRFRHASDSLMTIRQDKRVPTTAEATMIYLVDHIDPTRPPIESPG